MNNIYILYKFEPRAETNDILLYYASYDKSLLEEIILSIWEEASEKFHSFSDDDSWCNKTLSAYINTFNITNLPVI